MYYLLNTFLENKSKSYIFWVWDKKDFFFFNFCVRIKSNFILALTMIKS